MSAKKSIQMMMAILLAVFMTGMAAQAQAQSAYWKDVVAKAKKEGKVILYGTMGQVKLFPGIQKIMKEKYGIHADMVRLRGSQAMGKIEAEMAAGNLIASFMGSGASDGIRWNNMMQDIGELPEAIDPSAKWVINPFTYVPPVVPIGLVTTNLSPEGIIVNTNLIPPGTEPKTWKELADPKWRKKFVLQDPRRPGLPPSLFGYLLRLGYSHEWFKKVLDNAIITREGRMITPQLVRGEYPMFICAIYRYMHVVMETQPEVPAKFYIPEEGTYVTGTTFGILKNAPHPNAARVFLNECLSVEGQRYHAEEGAIPLRAGVPLKYPQYQDPSKLKLMDPFPTPPELLAKMPGEVSELAKKLMGK